MAAKPISTRAAFLAACCAIAAPVVIMAEGTVKVGYKDPIGVVTACTGHTGSDAILGKVYADAQCNAFLQSDLTKHATGIDACIQVDVPVKSQAAFTSFAFNTGTSAFCNSTMARKLNAGDLPGACAELSRWTYAGGKQWPGLVKRRTVERALCEEGLHS